MADVEPRTKELASPVSRPRRLTVWLRPHVTPKPQATRLGVYVEPLAGAGFDWSGRQSYTTEPSTATWNETSFLPAARLIVNGSTTIWQVRALNVLQPACIGLAKISGVRAAGAGSAPRAAPAAAATAAARTVRSTGLARVIGIRARRSDR